MAAAAPTASTSGLTSDLQKLEDTVKPWRDRINQARSHRRRYEPTWHSNLAFAAGKHDLVWDRYDRKLTLPPDLRGKDDLYVADVITEQFQAALGELASDDDRPELLAVQDGENAEEIEKHLNDCVGHGWDHEWDSQNILLDVRRKVLTLGVAAVRCRFDPTVGPLKLEIPHQQGKPVYEPADARKYVADEAAAGRTAEFRDIHEGRTRWETGSPFNFLVPPGVPHERDFPWEIWVRPTPLEAVREQYGNKAAGLTEDTDIASILGLGAKENDGGRGAEPAGENGEGSGRLRDHVWLYTCYKRPDRKFPKGQLVVLGSNGFTLLDETRELPYRAPDGSYRSGITYFHWWRLNDRFWSRALIETMKDPQRMINRRRRQTLKLVDRGLPKLVVEKGQTPPEVTGEPVELIQVEKQSVPPVVWPGVAPGEHLYREVQEYREDLAHASTLSALRLGENPQNVTTYSQLALLNENESLKRATILGEHKLAVGQLVENSVWDIREYWPDQKRLLIAGDDGQVSAAAYRKSDVPDFYVVKVAKGAAKPRSQAAELQKVQDIATYSLNAHQPLPVPWYAESLDAGEVVELPQAPTSDQLDVAQMENHLLLSGQPAPVMYYDNAEIHVPAHRQAQDQARIAGDMQALQALEEHVQEHLAVAAQQTPPPPPLAGAAPAPAAAPTAPPAAAPTAPPQ